MFMPQTQVPKEKWTLPYSLSASKRHLDPLFSDMEAFCKWSRMGNRFDRGTGPVAESTMEGITTTIYSFLGYLEHHEGVSAPSLLNFLNAEEYIRYLSFSCAKGRTVNSITNIISHTKKALTWLSKTKTSLSARALEIIVWLDTVKKQLQITMPRKKRDVGDLEEQGMWIEAAGLVRLVDDFEKKSGGRWRGWGRRDPWGIPLPGGCTMQLWLGTCGPTFPPSAAARCGRCRSPGRWDASSQIATWLAAVAIGCTTRRRPSICCSPTTRWRRGDPFLLSAVSPEIHRVVCDVLIAVREQCAP